jgi:hypothetical protein
MGSLEDFDRHPRIHTRVLTEKLDAGFYGL